MQDKIRRNKKGFTLIELIVVMIIIGILVILATPRFLNYIEKSRYTRIINDTRVAEDVTTAYLSKYGKLPVDYDKDKVDHIKILKENQSYLKEGEIQFKDSTKSRKYSEKDYLKYIEMINKNRSRRQNPPVGFQVEGSKENFNFDYYKLPDEFVKREIGTRLKGDFLVNEEGFAIYTTNISKPEGPETEKPDPEEPEGWWPETYCEPKSGADIFSYKKIGENFSEGLEVAGFRDKYLLEIGRRYSINLILDGREIEDLSVEDKAEVDRLIGLKDKIENADPENLDEELKAIREAGIRAPKNITIEENLSTREIWIDGEGPNINDLPVDYRVIKIGEDAFSNNSKGYNIIGLNISAGGIVYIDKNAFAHNNIRTSRDMNEDELEAGEIPCDPGKYKLVIPESVKKIGERAFYDNNIKVLEFAGDSENKSQIELIGENAFSNNGMKGIKYNNSASNSASIPEVHDELRIEKNAFSNTVNVAEGKKNSFRSVNISYNTVSIGEGAFSGLETESVRVRAKYSITGTLISNSKLESIGKRAFADNKIKNLEFAEGLEKSLYPIRIEDEAFMNNMIEERDDISYYGGVRIGEVSNSGSGSENGYVNGERIKVLKLPKALVGLGKDVFKNNENLERVLIYNGIKENDPKELLELNSSENAFDGLDFNSVFNNAGDKKIIDLPGLMKRTGDSWSYISDVPTYIFEIKKDIDDKLKIFGFTDEYMNEIYGTRSEIKIQTPVKYRYVENNRLKQEDIKGIRKEAFLKEAGLYSLIYAKVDLDFIEERAFKGNDLEEVDLYNVKTIGEEAFAENNITALSKPKDLRVFEKGVFRDNEISRLTNLTRFMYGYSIEEIKDFAFDNNNIKEVEISNENKNIIVKIGENAFRNNPDLNKVLIRSGSIPSTDKVAENAFPGDLASDKTFKKVYEPNTENRQIEMRRYEEDGETLQVGDADKGIWIFKEKEEELPPLPDQFIYERYEEDGEESLEIVGISPDYLEEYLEREKSKEENKKLRVTKKLPIKLEIKPSIELEDGVERKIRRIGERAFKGFERKHKDFRLAELKMGENIVSIGKEAFEGNSLYRIEDLGKYQLKIIEESAFENNKLSGGLSIWGRVSKVERRAFANNIIGSISISSGEIDLEEEAFYNNNSSLYSVSIGSRNINIGERVFSNDDDKINERMKYVSISSREATIKESAFRNNSKLDRVLFNKIEDRKININSDKTFPGENFKTAYEANYKNKDGETFSLVRNVLGVEEGRWELEFIALPPDPKDPYTFEDDMFIYKALTNQESEKNAKIMSFTDSYIERMKGKDKEIYISEKVSTIIDSKEREFAIKEIESNAFSNEGNGHDIVYVKMPNPLTKVGDFAFANNKIESLAIDTLRIGSNAVVAKSLGKGSFSNNNINNLIIPERISIGEEAFINNRLENLKIERNTSIGRDAFLGNRNLESVTTMYIGGNLLNEIFPGLNFKGAHDGAYKDTENKKMEMFVRDKLGEDNIGNWSQIPEASGEGDCLIGGNFRFCNFEKGENGEESTVTLAGFKEGYTNNTPVLPSIVIKRDNQHAPGIKEDEKYRVVVIKEDAFRDAGLRDVKFPNALREIEKNAFRNNQIKRVELRNKMERINLGAFSENDSLELVILNKNVELIEEPTGLFNALLSLFKSDVQTEIFPEYEKFKEVFRLEGLPERRIIAREIKSSDSLDWGIGILKDDKDSLVDNLGDKIIGLKDKNSKVNDKLILPDYYENSSNSMKSITRIVESAFENKGIEELKLPINLEVIERKAFENNNIKELELIKSLKEVRARAFWNNDIDTVSVLNENTSIRPFAIPGKDFHHKAGFFNSSVDEKKEYEYRLLEDGLHWEMVIGSDEIEKESDNYATIVGDVKYTFDKLNDQELSLIKMENIGRGNNTRKLVVPGILNIEDHDYRVVEIESNAISQIKGQLLILPNTLRNIRSNAIDTEIGYLILPNSINRIDKNGIKNNYPYRGGNTIVIETGIDFTNIDSEGISLDGFNIKEKYEDYNYDFIFNELGGYAHYEYGNSHPVGIYEIEIKNESRMLYDAEYINPNIEYDDENLFLSSLDIEYLYGPQLKLEPSKNTNTLIIPMLGYYTWSGLETTNGVSAIPKNYFKDNNIEKIIDYGSRGYRYGASYLLTRGWNKDEDKGLDQELVDLINNNLSKNGVYEKIDGDWSFREVEGYNILDELRK